MTVESQNLVINSMKGELDKFGLVYEDCGPDSITVVKYYTPPHGVKMTHEICTISCRDGHVRVVPMAFEIDFAEPGTFERLFEAVKVLNEMVQVSAQIQTEQIVHDLPFKIEYRQIPQTKIANYVSFNGEEFEFYNMLELLREIDDGSIHVTGGATTLKKLGIITYEGSRRNGISATFGPNGKPLIAELEKHELRLEE